jgi:serine/threonine protein kinase
VAQTAPGKSPSKPAEARPHVTIGRYEIKRRLGRGGMGMVYLGLDGALEREVAIKTLTAEGTFDEENRQRFEIEAKAAARLQHPNIVTVYELGEDRGVPFIAMELLPGSDLETLLRGGEGISLAEKLDIVIQVCRGLAFAHEHKIVHRDIKPSNIRLLDDGTVKIMDFGIAKLGSTNVTKSGMMVGTMNYMSPEQIRGLPLDGRCDVFSLGVILFQLLAGRRPFIGKGGPDVLYKIVQEPTPRLELDLGPETAALQAIVDKALEKEVDQRYASAVELEDALARVQATAPAMARLSTADQEMLSGSRRALKEGRLDEAQQRLEPVLRRAPDSLEARRLLRAVQRRQQQTHKPQPEPASEEFPELEATYRAHATVRAPDTLVTTAVAPASAPAAVGAGAARFLLPLGGVLLLGALGAGVLLLRNPQSTPKQAVAEPVKPKPAASPERLLPPPPAPVKLSVEAEPNGASLSLDGRSVGSAPTVLSVDPAKDQRLVVSADGYASQEVKLVAGKLPTSLRLTLEPAGPPGTLNVVSSYPIDVYAKGKLLVKGQLAPKLPLAPGRQLVTLAAPAQFMRKELTLDVKPGASLGAEAPGLGKLSIKANPDNCEVFIDGAFVDYPPILEKPIAEGAHTVSFKWPDGQKRDEPVQVGKGQIAYVMGRRD